MSFDKLVRSARRFDKAVELARNRLARRLDRLASARAEIKRRLLKGRRR